MATSTYELLVAPERRRQQPQSNTATPQTATPQTAAPQATTQPVQATPSVQSTPPPAAPTAAKAPQTVTPPLAARENSAGYPTTGDITNWGKAAGVNAAPQATPQAFSCIRRFQCGSSRAAAGAAMPSSPCDYSLTGTRASPLPCRAANRAAAFAAMPSSPPRAQNFNLR